VKLRVQDSRDAHVDPDIGAPQLMGATPTRKGLRRKEFPKALWEFSTRGAGVHDLPCVWHFHRRRAG
jgi:hypothetical protein